MYFDWFTFIPDWVGPLSLGCKKTWPDKDEVKEIQNIINNELGNTISVEIPTALEVAITYLQDKEKWRKLCFYRRKLKEFSSDLNSIKSIFNALLRRNYICYDHPYHWRDWSKDISCIQVSRWLGKKTKKTKVLFGNSRKNLKIHYKYILKDIEVLKRWKKIYIEN